MIILISLFVVFAVNVCLISVVWDIYGDRIQVLIAKKDEKEHVLDQLRREAIELKLPKEHSPRI